MSAETVLAFDFGLKRIGVAVGNNISAGAEPLEIIRAETDDDRFERIGLLLKQWAPARLVVGRPMHPDGAAHAMTVRCDRFARQLEGRFGLPVVLVDERYSSVEAEAEQADRFENQPGRQGRGHGKSRRGSGAAAGSGGGRSGNVSGRGAGQNRSADAEGRLDAQAAAIILRQYWAQQG